MWLFTAGKAEIKNSSYIPPASLYAFTAKTEKIFPFMSLFNAAMSTVPASVPKFAGSNPVEAVGLLGRKKSSARLPSEGKKSHRSHVKDP